MTHERRPQSLVTANAHDLFSFELSRLVEAEYHSPSEAWARIYEPRLTRSGLSLQFYTAGGDLPEFCGAPDVTLGTYRRLAIARDAVHGTDVIIVRSSADLELVERFERRGLVLTIEGALPIGDQDLWTLRNFFALGLRSVILNAYLANQIGDGVAEQRGGGLTKFGRDVISELNRLGVLIDVTQASARMLADVLEASTEPVLASHSNPAAVYEHVRNLSDTQLTAIAEAGGVIGMSTFPSHVGSGRVTIDDFMRHVDHAVSLVGPQHVCLGLNIAPGSKESLERFYAHSGVDTTQFWLHGFEDIDRMPHFMSALQTRGYDDDTVAEICGRSLMRLLKAVLPR